MISRLNVKSVFSFIRSCQTVFQESYIIFHSHQQCMRIPVIPRLCQRFVLSVFQILVILINVQWYFIVLICISLLTYNLEHLSICLSPIYLLWSSALLRSLAHILIRLIFYHGILIILCIFYITVLY